MVHYNGLRIDCTVNSPKDGQLNIGVALCVHVRDVCLIEGEIKGVNKGRDQLQVSVLWIGGVNLIEASVKTVYSCIPPSFDLLSQLF